MMLSAADPTVEQKMTNVVPIRRSLAKKWPRIPYRHRSRGFGSRGTALLGGGAPATLFSIFSYHCCKISVHSLAENKNQGK